MKKTIVFVAMLISCSAFGAWIPVDAGGRVPMEPGATRSRDWTVFSFTVSRLPNRITDVNLRLDLVHSWVEDLQIILEAPDRSVVTLFDQFPGGPPRFDDFDDTVFDDEAPKAIQSASAPYAGAFRPKEALSRFDGRNPNGTWRLKIWDHYTGDYGWLYRQGDPRFETRRGPLSGTAIEISAVPEPLTWLALGGLAGMALRRRKTMR